MKATIQASRLHGDITAPASKSAMQRACAAALLSEGQTKLLNPGKSNDDKAALGIIKALGATVQEEPGGALLINGNFRHNGFAAGKAAPQIDCGESGLSIRMFTPIVALLDKEITITGSGSLQSRPMDFFDAVLPQLGVKINSTAGKLPLRVCGPLVPADITIDGSLSSQFLTGLLMAYGAAGAKGCTIQVNNLTSKPYIDLTIKLMEAFGMPVSHQEYTVFSFADRKPLAGNRIFTVEGDWSGAAFLLVAGAIAGNITVRGLDICSPQGDKNILQALMMAEAGLSVTTDAIEVRRQRLRAFHFNATDCPDLFPPLAALAAYCSGTSVIEGVGRLTHKESNRGLTLQQEFLKMGIQIRLQDDLMIIEGGEPVGNRVSSCHDHRIAMATAVAALGAEGVTVIEDAGAVNKSYPGFYEDLKMLGADVSLQ